MEPLCSALESLRETLCAQLNADVVISNAYDETTRNKLVITLANLQQDPALHASPQTVATIVIAANCGGADYAVGLKLISRAMRCLEQLPAIERMTLSISEWHDITAMLRLPYVPALCYRLRICENAIPPFPTQPNSPQE